MLLALLLACGGFRDTPETPAADDTATTDTGPATSVPPEPTEELSVLSINLQCLKLDGTPYATNEERFAAVAAQVAAGGVTAVAAQEVCARDGEDALAMLEDALEDATGELWSSRWAFAHVAWEGTPDQADEGVAVLAQGTLGDDIPVHYVSQAALTRVSLAAQLPSGHTLVSVHLDHEDAAAREDQARQTASWALSIADGPEVIVAGDFNDVDGSPAHQAMLDQGFVDGTRLLDAGRIDHVFVHRASTLAACIAETWFTEEPVSDHPGVVVHLVPQMPPEVPITRIVADVDVGFGRTLSVRGDTAPLSWDRGLWAWPAGSSEWRLVLTELDGPFLFKTLIDDTAWQTGDDVAAEAGEETVISPTF